MKIINKIIEYIKKNKEKIIVLLIVFILFIIILILGKNGRVKEMPEEKPSYAKTEKTEEDKKKEKDSFVRRVTEEEKNIKITSIEVKEMLKNDKLIKESKYGKPYIYDGKQVYPNKGFNIYKSYNRILYILLNEKYDATIFENINAKSNKKEIIDALGSPNYNDEDYLIYKNNEMYAIINLKRNEINVYNILNDIKLDKFWELYEEFLKEGNLKKYINTLTDMYPMYSEYTYNINGLVLKYANLGIEIDLRKGEKNPGIKIYSNYIGNIDEIKNLKGVYIKETNLIFEEEIKRQKREEAKEKFEMPRLLYEENELFQYLASEKSNLNIKGVLKSDSKIEVSNEELRKIADEANQENKKGKYKLSDIRRYKEIEDTKKYKIYYEIKENEDRTKERRGKHNFYNVVIINKKSNLKFNISTAGVADYILLTENKLIYSIANVGIYSVDIQSGEKQHLKLGEGEHRLRYYKDGYLFFDSNKIKLN